MKNNVEYLEYVVIDYIKDDNILLSIDKFLLSDDQIIHLTENDKLLNLLLNEYKTTTACVYDPSGEQSATYYSYLRHALGYIYGKKGVNTIIAMLKIMMKSSSVYYPFLINTSTLLSAVL